MAVGMRTRRPQRCRAGTMTQSTHDKIEGKVHELKGKVKETAGKVTNDPELTAEGQSEHITGSIQKKIGQIEKVFEK